MDINAGARLAFASVILTYEAVQGKFRSAPDPTARTSACRRYNSAVLVSDFDYRLPKELIAQEPLAERAASRMLRLERSSGAYQDRWFRDFPGLLRADDLVVINNTRVFPARLYGRRGGWRAQPVSRRNPAARGFLHGRVEVLLTRQLRDRPQEWEALVHPGRKIGVGERLYFGERDELQAEVVARGEFGERRLRFFHPAAPDPSPASAGSGRAAGTPVARVEDFFAIVERLGHVPLPPYIARADQPDDRERYQTVYARERGSVAAPTAGLHFTPAILDRMRARGIETAEVTLHVGLGTFQPVRAEKVEEHRMHSEWYQISEAGAERISRALAAGRRVVAVGTTTVRTLEHAASRTADGRVPAGSGEADVFIYPGFEFRVVGALLTNFHLPKSTLLMMVSAFAGREQVLAAYEHAVRERYRFFSYGDCMFIE